MKLHSIPLFLPDNTLNPEAPKIALPGEIHRYNLVFTPDNGKEEEYSVETALDPDGGRHVFGVPPHFTVQVQGLVDQNALSFGPAPGVNGMTLSQWFRHVFAK